MIKVYADKKECCGCTACSNVCPTKAIEMKADEEGFKYPSIDQDKCINCGLCKKTCDFQYERSDFAEPKIYAAKHKNESIRNESTSGGAFSAISDYILKNNGVVYGVRLNENMVAIHSRATTSEEINRFKGSKYVQSDLNSVFEQVKDDLNNFKMVLFSGTPCQCAGLNSFLEKKGCNQDRLILCDIVCHGVPSPKVFSDYIDLIERENKKKVVNYAFRSKTNGWHRHTEGCMFEDGSQDFSSRKMSVNKKLFYDGNTLRPSCYECRYTSFSRPSDITIADFWGIEKIMPEFDDNKGVSLILVNTQKGNIVFNEIKGDLEIRESDKQGCLQHNLQQPTAKPQNRSEFWKTYRKKGFKYISDTITENTIRIKIRRKMAKFLSK